MSRVEVLGGDPNRQCAASFITTANLETALKRWPKWMGYRVLDNGYLT